MKIFWRILELLAGGLFIYAGLLKVVDPISFADEINNYRVLPWEISVWLAFFLPWLEIICGLAVILRQLYTGALSLLAGAMLIFVGATVAARLRGLDISCGCFGKMSSSLNFAGHMALDLALLTIFVVLLWRALAGADWNEKDKCEH